MIGSDDLARLIQAAIPTLGRDEAHARLSRLQLTNPALDRFGVTSGMAPSEHDDQQRWPTDAPHNALKRALLNQTLASMQVSTLENARPAQEAALPYITMSTDRAASTEAIHLHAPDGPAKLTPEQPPTLNPALAMVATQLAQTLTSVAGSKQLHGNFAKPAQSGVEIHANTAVTTSARAPYRSALALLGIAVVFALTLIAAS